MRQEVVLAMLAKEPTYGYDLRARLREALGPLGGSVSSGQIYVTLSRLEKAGMAQAETTAGAPDRPDRKIYSLAPAGHRKAAEWIGEVDWPRPDLAEFHLKLIAAAAGGLADPLEILDAQRRELLQVLREAQRAVMGATEGSGTARLLLEGVVLRLQADLAWLEVCERNWTPRRTTP